MTTADIVTGMVGRGRGQSRKALVKATVERKKWADVESTLTEAKLCRKQIKFTSTTLHWLFFDGLNLRHSNLNTGR